MILESITLYNFRQYLNEQTIEFAYSSTRNVTVIHGENGSGKTALLNSFLWCLYGELNLPNQDNIINDQAITEAKIGDSIEAYVQLNFRNNFKKYILKRYITAEKIDKDHVKYHKPTVSLFISEDGQSEEIKNTTEEIYMILPKELRTYFFFDGERIDNLSKEEGSEDIRNAIKTIMRLTILERSIEHTDSARKRFRTELKNYGDPRTKKICEEQEQLEKEKKDEEEKKKILEENFKSLERQMREIDEKLIQIEDAKHLQEQRNDKQEQLRKVSEKLKDLQKELTHNVSKYGHYAFTSKILSESKSILNEIHKNEKIVGITESFINNLVENKKCICGTPLEEESEQLKRLLELSNQLNYNEIDITIDNFKQEITRIDERRKKLFSDLHRLKKSEIDYTNEYRLLKEEIAEISSKLTEKKSEEIVDLENKRRDLLQKKSDIDRSIGRLDEKIDSLSKKIHEKNQEQERHKKLEKESLLAEKRMKVCEDIITAMKKILDIREKNVKRELQDRISKVYSQFLRKNYNIILTDDYELKVINEKGNNVAMSQGERQITSLSFIGAIVDIAREIYKRENKTEFVDGGIYPIVMDSPFGALDSDHRERVAKGITKLADQIIVIVSTSQWKGEVEKELSPYIGKEYKLVYNDPRYNKVEPYEYTVIKEEV